MRWRIYGNWLLADVAIIFFVFIYIISQRNRISDRSVRYINLIFLKGERNKFPVVFSLLKTSEERNAWQLAAVRSVVCTAIAQQWRVVEVVYSNLPWVLIRTKHPRYCIKQNYQPANLWVVGNFRTDNCGSGSGWLISTNCIVNCQFQKFFSCNGF